jgi:hypothetical protein
MSVVEPVSRETRKVSHGPLQSNYAIDINKYTLEGNNKMINASINTMRSNRISILRIDLALIHGQYQNWSNHPIKFSREDHPSQVPQRGHTTMVLKAQIEGYDVSRVFMDQGAVSI